LKLLKDAENLDVWFESVRADSARFGGEAEYQQHTGLGRTRKPNRQPETRGRQTRQTQTWPDEWNLAFRSRLVLGRNDGANHQRRRTVVYANPLPPRPRRIFGPPARPNLATIDAVRKLLNSGQTPPPDYDKRGKVCSLVEICQPELLGKRDRSVGYVEGLFDSS
jgi:hypothetical protein